MKNRKFSSKQIEYHEDTTTWVPKGEILTGMISCQPGSWSSEPIIVTDGVELSWDEFAHTMLVYEGFKFKLEFIDPANIVIGEVNKNAKEKNT